MSSQLSHKIDSIIAPLSNVERHQLLMTLAEDYMWWKSGCRLVVCDVCQDPDFMRNDGVCGIVYKECEMHGCQEVICEPCFKGKVALCRKHK